MHIAVDQGGAAFAVQGDHVDRTGEIQVGEGSEAVGEAVGVAVDRHLYEHRATVAARGTARRKPRQVATGREPRRAPVASVEPRELLDDVARTELDVGVLGSREAATCSFEVLEHHHILVGAGFRRRLEVGEDRARDA